jgi:hypothetical protein
VRVREMMRGRTSHRKEETNVVERNEQKKEGKKGGKIWMEMMGRHQIVTKRSDEGKGLAQKRNKQMNKRKKSLVGSSGCVNITKVI